MLLTILREFQFLAFNKVSTALWHVHVYDYTISTVFTCRTKSVHCTETVPLSFENLQSIPLPACSYSSLILYLIHVTTCLNAWNSISDNFILLVKVVMAQRDLKWVIQFLKLFFKARILLIVFTHVICDTKMNYRHRWIKSTHHISHIVFKNVIAYWSMFILNTQNTSYTFLLIFCYFRYNYFRNIWVLITCILVKQCSSNTNRVKLCLN